MRAGSPTTSDCFGTLRVTRAPGAMVAPSPTLTGSRILAWAPIQTPVPICGPSGLSADPHLDLVSNTATLTETTVLDFDAAEVTQCKAGAEFPADIKKADVVTLAQRTTRRARRAERRESVRATTIRYACVRKDIGRTDRPVPPATRGS